MEDYNAEDKRGFWAAVHKTWPYWSLGIVVGLALLIIDHFAFTKPIKGSPLIEISSLLVHNLGIGFMVSAIAVCFYEWGSREKEMFSHSEALVSLQRDLVALKAIQGKAAVKRGLEQVLPGNGEPESKLRSTISKLVEDISHLLYNSEWVKNGHLPTLVEQLESMSSNATTLCNFDQANGDHPFEVGGPEAAHELIVSLVANLDKNDEYLALSNLESWVEHKLDTMHNKIDEALRNGVIVKRIFNLLRDSSRLDPNRVQAVLKTQMERVAASGGTYDVHLLCESDLALSNLADTGREIAVAQMVFFKKGARVLRINVRRPDLSYLLISSAPPIYRRDLIQFDTLWRLSKPLTRENIDSSLIELFGKQ